MPAVKALTQAIRLKIQYDAEPVIGTFHNSDAFVRGLMGPIGSGKSVGCIQEQFKIGLEQPPGPDGICRSRHGVIRNTYPELKSTTIKSFQDWFGDIARFAFDSPITAIIELEGDEEQGVPGYHMEFVFLSMDVPKDVKKLKSLELTTCWINEAVEVPKAALDMATGRVGRYPPKKDGGCVHSCVILDTNPPDDDHWWYKTFEEEKPDDYALFKQPPALLKIEAGGETIYLPNPKCENVKHQTLGFTYWTRQIGGKTAEWIKVFILGQYGTSYDGRPCYPKYNDAVHSSEKPLAVYKGIKLLIGIDFGRTPAAIIAQLSPMGQLRVIDEVVVDADGKGMGVRTFTREVLRPHLAQHYTGMEAMVWGDPSGVTLNDSEESTFDIMGQEDVPAEPAGSNSISFRLENVDYFLGTMVDGEPGFIMDRKVKILRKGFLGGYQFERVQVAGEARYKDQPMKNKYSHPHDGCQYVADLARHGTTKIVTKAKARPVEAAPNAGAY